MHIAFFFALKQIFHFLERVGFARIEGSGMIILVFHPDPEQFFTGACKKSVFPYDQAVFRIEFKKVAEKSSGKILEMMKTNRFVTIAELAEVYFE